jgi:uncharacterized protein
MRARHRTRFVRLLLLSLALPVACLLGSCDQFAYEMARHEQNSAALDAAHAEDYQAMYRLAVSRASSEPEMLGLVGFLTLIGAGTPQDPKQALAILAEASNEGANMGYFGLGYAYSYGIGVPANSAGAAHYYSAIGGPACASMDDATTSFERLVLAERDIHGFCRHPGDPRAGFQRYRSIENSLPVASLALGYLYASGTGTAADPAQAQHYFQQAAAQGLIFTAPGSPPAPPSSPGSSGAKGQLIATGTAFAISAKGTFLTNYHVIADCKRITIGDNEVYKGLSDQTDDLATLYSRMKTPNFATFQVPGYGTTGESVVAVGYPLTGILATQANVTAGIVSATAGLGGDERYVQITAPVQPGNSGGPLLDSGGLVLGVVSLKLNPEATIEAAGSLPENVNFAIKTAVVLSFLEYDGTRPRTATKAAKLDVTDIAAAAQRYTYLVNCWN